MDVNNYEKEHDYSLTKRESTPLRARLELEICDEELGEEIALMDRWYPVLLMDVNNYEKEHKYSLTSAVLLAVRQVRTSQS